MPAASRGSVWVADLGMAAKVRPCLVLSIPTGSQDRVLVTVVPHTTSTYGTLFEVDIPAPFLQGGVFDAQQIVTVAQARLIKHIGDLSADELALVEDAVLRWLGLDGRGVGLGLSGAEATWRRDAWGPRGRPAQPVDPAGARRVHSCSAATVTGDPPCAQRS